MSPEWPSNAFEKRLGHFGHINGARMGAAVLCDDGTSKLYAVDDNPTFGQHRWSGGVTYEQTRTAVLNATGWSYPEELRWAETDENGLRESDLGGPASTVPRVSTRASAAELMQ